MEYIKIINWKELQHYKDRDPLWIKLYRNILDKYEFDCLQDDSKLLQIMLWLLAAKYDNKIPYDMEFIQKKASLKNEVTPQMMQPLFNNGFIARYQDDSKLLPFGDDPDSTEQEQDQYTKEKETYKQEQEQEAKSQKLGLQIAERLDLQFKPFTDREQKTFSRLARHLAAWGADGNGELLPLINEWIQCAKQDHINKPKAMFVKICKEKTGYTKTRKIL